MTSDDLKVQPIAPHFTIKDLSDATDSDAHGQDWWVPRAMVGQERRASAALGDLGFEVWYPTRLVTFRTRHMKKPVQRIYPTFPGYLFARPTGSRPTYRYRRVRGVLERQQIDTERHDQHWREMDALDEIRSVLMCQGRATTVRAEELQVVRAYLDDLANKPIDIQIWRKNDEARIVDGPWQGFGAIISQEEVRGKVKVLMKMLGAKRPIEMPVGMLEKVA